MLHGLRPGGLRRVLDPERRALVDAEHRASSAQGRGAAAGNATSTAATSSQAQGSGRSSSSSSEIVPSGTVQRAYSQRGFDAENASTGGRPPNPCSLVSVAEAQTITDGAVAARSLGPLGPTCIYRLSHSREPITLSVESVSLARVTRHMASRQRVTVKNRGAVGSDGQCCSCRSAPLAS